MSYQTWMQSASSQPGRWIAPALILLGIGLIFNALALLYGHGSGKAAPLLPGSSVFGADATNFTGGSHIYMMPAQLNSSAWGFVLLDTATRRVCVYRILTTASRLRLMAVRDFSSDLKLSDFNNAAPTPAQVKAMLRMPNPQPHKPAKGLSGN